jgi:hypothetical protein
VAIVYMVGHTGAGHGPGGPTVIAVPVSSCPESNAITSPSTAPVTVTS